MRPYFIGFKYSYHINYDTVDENDETYYFFSINSNWFVINDDCDEEKIIFFNNDDEVVVTRDYFLSIIQSEGHYSDEIEHKDIIIPIIIFNFLYRHINNDFQFKLINISELNLLLNKHELEVELIY